MFVSIHLVTFVGNAFATITYDYNNCVSSCNGAYDCTVINANQVFYGWADANGDYIEDIDNYDGTAIAQCKNGKFAIIIKTTEENDIFSFVLSARGNFTIDYGNGYIRTINKTSGSSTTYKNTASPYITPGIYALIFDGTATSYLSGGTAAIRFSANNKVIGIYGSLGAIFSTLGNTEGLAGNSSALRSIQPVFTETFQNNTNLRTPIPKNLFSGVTGTPTDSMFHGTFSGCSNLRHTDIDDPNNPGMKYAIPPTLFAGISGAPSTEMFRYAFYNCTGLTGTIPATLFSGVRGAPANGMFFATFSYCTNLTGSIPETLFSGISGAPARNMFINTFFRNEHLTGSIPANLFSGLSGAPAFNMFEGTFSGCKALTGTDIDDPNNPGMKYAIPPTLFAGISGAPDGEMFESTFFNCSGLVGTIPRNLFSGIRGAPTSKMFYSTFQGCSGLTGSIPANLFGGISGAPAENMFYGTFTSCSGLSGTDIDDPNQPGYKYAIPPTLFAGIIGAPATSMFSRTFYGCSGLTGTIPGSLFSGISGAPKATMFSELFRNCTGLTGSIPGDLFSGISGKPATSMFNSTFYGCSGLTGSIPSNLFSGISGKPAGAMFYSTFAECNRLRGPIPGDLFSGIIGKPEYRSFNSTFRACTNLGKDTINNIKTYYIPPELFAGISVTSEADTMTGIFTGTGLLETCPRGTSQYTTGFESYFSNRKSCTSCPVEYPLYDSTNDTCYAQVTFIDSDDNALLKKEDVYYDAQNASGYNLPSYSPVKPDTVIDNWKNGSGTVIAANDVLTGNQVVYSDWGFHCDSGHYFHVGNEQICAAETKRTEHAMVIQFDPEHTYYIHATPNSEHDYTINSSSIHKMKANYNGTIYNLHDASVYFDN